MRKVLFFMATSLDGYFEGPNQDLNWHNVDDEFNEFAIEQIDGVDILLFGRVTYEMMASFWPTSYAIETDPIVAEKMNSMPKIVFSKTLSGADWNNTRLVKTNFVEEISRLKHEPGKDLIIFGSSDLAVTFLQHGLLDEIRILVNPVVLGNGKPLFKGIPQKLNLKLLKTRTFHNGNVLLYYQPVSGLPAGLAQPAQRALAGAGIQNLEQLARFSRAEIQRLHGIGPNALTQLQHALNDRGLSFNNSK